MRRRTASRRHVAAIGIVAVTLLLAPSCEQENDLLVTNIGTSQFLLVDPGLTQTSVADPEGRIQVAAWTVDSATLLVEGMEFDLLFGDPTGCELAESIASTPRYQGQCASGLVLDSVPEATTAVVEIIVAMRVARAVPPPIRPGGDWDGDGIGNSVDNCVLRFNSDQRDTTGRGYGDACTNPFTGLLDSDGDGIDDGFDNCVWFPNTDQANTTGLTAAGFNDGIGDACHEQVATVRSTIEAPAATPEAPIRRSRTARSGTIRLLRSAADFRVPLGSGSFLVFDFDDQVTMSCDWDALECRLDPSQVTFCFNTSIFGALAGCP